jgi:hypothetical protein
MRRRTVNPIISLSFRGVGDPGAPGYISYVELPEFVSSDLAQTTVSVIGAGVSFRTPHSNRDIDVEVLGSLADALTAVGEMVRKAAERDWLLSDLHWSVS